MTGRDENERSQRDAMYIANVRARTLHELLALLAILKSFCIVLIDCELVWIILIL